MSSTEGRSVADKWLKTSILNSDPVVSKYIPETQRFTSEKFSNFLAKYNRVVLKPKIGTGGHGLILIQKAEEKYQIQYYNKVYKCKNMGDTLGRIKRITAGRDYLMQPGIHLATIQGRPLDYRVKIVKVGHDWKITAMVGKWARHGLFVTNLCRGGTQLSFKQAISRSLHPNLVMSIRSEMRSITWRSTRLLEERFPGINQLGFDYGVDKKGRIWFFEVNTSPH